MKTTSTQLTSKNQKGFLVPLTALMLLGFIGLAALVIDIGRTRVEHRRLNNATDAAALAGVGALVASGGDSAVAIQEATRVALANNMTSSEISSVGSIQVGVWDGTSFTAGASGPNAVRVPGARRVGMTFAAYQRSEITPGVDSIAALAAANGVPCAIPFGIEDDVLFNPDGSPKYQVGDEIEITRESPGNWGKLDIGGNMSSRNTFIDAMMGGNCESSVDVNQLVSPGTGFAGVIDGFSWRLQHNPIITVSVVDGFPNGNSQDVTVLGFAVFELVSQRGNGANWVLRIRFSDQTTGTYGGGSMNTNGIFANARVLVQ